MPFAHVAEHLIIQLGSPSVTTRIIEALLHDLVLYQFCGPHSVAVAASSRAIELGLTFSQQDW
jgi:hypothetical protein